MSCLRACIVFLLTLLSFDAYAQNSSIVFNRISIANGLSNNNITAVAQDSLGFMWLGTYQGLNRYDGYEFKKFYTLPGVNNSLPDDNITSLVYSPDSTLWISTNSKGLVSYNPVTDKFTHYKEFLYSPEDDSYPKILKIFSDKRGLIWVSTDEGKLIRVSYSHNKVSTILSSIKLVNNYSKNIPINDFSFLTDSKLLVGTDVGLFFLSLDNSFNITENKLLLDKPVIRINLVKDKVFLKIYFGISKVYFSNLNPDKITPEGLEFKRFFPDPNNIQVNVPDMINYKNQILFVADPFHLISYTWDLQTEIYEQNLTSLLDNNLHVSVSSFFVDKNKSLWILTRGFGALVEQKKQNIFSSLKNIPGDLSSLAPVSLRQIVEDKKNNDVWITGYNGISLFQPGTGKVERIPFNYPAYSLTLIPDQSKYFFIGTDGSGLYLGNRETKKIKQLNLINNNESILKLGQIFSIYVDKKENVWLGTLEGLMKFKLPADLENVPSEINVEYTSIYYTQLKTSSKVSQIYPVSDSLFYLATESHGIIKYNISNDTYTEMKYNSDNPASISGNNIKIIYRSSDGNYWVGTTSGLNKWSKDDFNNFRNNFERILTSDGLPNNVIYGILEDKNQNLWLSTNLGLSRFNPSEFTFDNFSEQDGLANEEFNTNSYLETSTGEMYFGGISGLTYFNPENIINKKSGLNVVFTSLSVLTNNHNSIKNIVYTKSVELNNNENIFSISFSALNYNNIGNIEYSYRLDGLDSIWINSDQTQKVTFTNLSPGNYKLWIRAKTSFTEWGNNLAELSITVLPPIWQTWWMYLTYVIIILLVLYVAIKFELSRQRHKQQAELEKVRVENLLEINKAKSYFFANISHELRTPLTVVLGMLESIKTGVREKYDVSEIEEKIDTAYKSGKKQLNMVNQILHLTKLDAGEEKLNASIRNIEPLIRSIYSSFESLAELNNLQLSFSSDCEIIPVNFDADKIEKIMNNLLSNAIKFTPAGGKISINIISGLNETTVEKKITDSWKIKHIVKIIVKDTGTGIPQEKLSHIFERFFQADSSSTRKYEGIGIGLSLTKELVELHNGKIEAESKFGEGTTFTISLPIDFTYPFSEIKNPEPPRIELHENLESNIPETETARTGKTSILVIEDNKDLRYYIKETLKLNYDIVEAPDGKKGIEIAEKEIPDLIITDAMMPNMDGFEMTKLLRESNTTSHIPIIMITARAAEEDKLTGLEAGVDAYLTKPFNTKELLLRVQKLLELREKLYEKIKEGAFVNPLELKINSLDQQFLNKLKETVMSNIGNEYFTVKVLAEKMIMSERQLHRKLGALMDLSPIAYVRKLRMKTAHELLINGNGNVSQVSLEVGYSSFTSFAKAFKNEFGVSPSQVLHN